MSRSRWLQVGVGSLVLAVLVGGIAIASGRTNSPTSAGDKHHYADEFVDRLASKLGITPDRLRAAGKDTAEEVIDQALKDGKITAAQAQKLRAMLAKRELFRFGLGKLGRSHGLKAFGELKMTALHAAAAKLGMTNGALLESLRSGKTIADLAKAKGVSLASLGAAVADAVKPVLNRLVKSGALSQERATTLLDAIRSGTFFEHRFFGHKFRGDAAA